jgi:hypothetical protein
LLLTRLPCVVAICLLGALIANATEVPRIAKSGAAGQLVVNGKPYLILGGELGNSCAGTAAQADSILPQIARMHVNTVLMPVAWEQIEPVEGSFDFSILDHWMGGGTGTAFAPGGFVVRKLEERRLQLRTCVGEQRYKTLPESRLGRRG